MVRFDYRKAGKIISFFVLFFLWSSMFLDYFDSFFYNQNLFVKIVSFMFISIFVFTMGVYWKSLISLKEFFKMLGRIQIWTFVVMLLSLISTTVIFIQSDIEQMGVVVKRGNNFFLENHGHILQPLSFVDVRKIAISDNMFLLSMAFSFYAFAQMILIKKKCN